MVIVEVRRSYHLKHGLALSSRVHLQALHGLKSEFQRPRNHCLRSSYELSWLVLNGNVNDLTFQDDGCPRNGISNEFLQKYWCCRHSMGTAEFLMQQELRFLYLKLRFDRSPYWHFLCLHNGDVRDL